MSALIAEAMCPESEAQVADAVRTAIVEGRPLELLAGGSKRGWGRPPEAGERLDLHRLSGIVAYEPEELVLTARPGTPLAEIAAALAEHRQHLAFEPPDFAPLLGGGAGGASGGGASGGGTLGGAIACNLGGPRRIKAGAARDHLLGFHAVSGRGECFKAGGRVVKNVTGFDLSKLLAGAFGTLAVLTEVTVRALPAPEDVRTLQVHGLDDERALAAMTAALASTADVGGAAHLPADVAAASAVPSIGSAGAAATVLRLEGPAPSVAARAAALTELLRPFGEAVALAAADGAALWRELSDASCLRMPRERPIWRLSVPPASGVAVVRQIRERLIGHAFYDWGGGLIWLALAPSADAGESVVRGAVGITGGHATLFRAEAPVRGRVPVFQPQAPALAALTRRIKHGFDPGRILNPGRMYADL